MFFGLLLTISWLTIGNGLGLRRGEGKDFRGTVVNSAAGLLSVVAPQSCAGPLLMTGYSSDLYPEDDYRFQPSCYNSGGANRLMCFPGSAVVTTPLGDRDMKEIVIGDSVLTLGSDGQLEFQKVLFFLHREPNRMGSDWIRVVHRGGSLTLSANHLVMIVDEWGKLISRRAQHLQNGDTLRVMYHGSLISSIVLSVSVAANHVGVFAPVTDSGMVVVNGVLASNYAPPEILTTLPEGYAHMLSHWAVLPLKIVAKLSDVLSNVPGLAHVLPAKQLIAMSLRSAERIFSTITSLK